MTLLCGSVDIDAPPESAVRAMAHVWGEMSASSFHQPNPRVALGVSRVRAAGADPPLVMARAGEGAAIVADVRLDNRDDLRRLLPGLDQSSDDAAIVFAAWRRWGVDCCEHLMGDFAFAVWDDSTGQLFCGRDLVGAKTLYYWARPGGGFAFASQLAALLAHPDLDRRLDPAAAVDHLLLLHRDAGGTLFRDVHRLPPGHALTFSKGHSRPRTWRHTDFRPATVRLPSLDDWADGLRTELEQAVTDRLPGRGRVGAHLSGGLDSSAVVAMAAADRPLHEGELVAISFSAAPGSSIGGDDPVDAEFIVAMQDRHGLQVHHPKPDLVPFPDALRLASPGMMPPPYLTSSMHGWAAGLGIDTMLSGWGGDEASSFNGRSHSAELLRRGRLVKLLQVPRQLRPPVRLRRRRRFLWEHAVAPNLPDAVFWWLGRHDPIVNRLPRSVVNEPMAYELGTQEHLRHGLRTRSTTRATQLALLHSAHLVNRIEAWSADASRFGIDYRYPLLDQRVLELCLAAPTEAFLHEGVSRWLFRRSVEPHLPQKVAWRVGKKDSWMQRRQAADRSAVGASTHTQWVVEQANRMVAEGNDLGGVVDLAKLRRSISAVPESGFGAGAALAARVPLIGSALAAELAAFVEHNRVSLG